MVKTHWWWDVISSYVCISKLLPNLSTADIGAKNQIRNFASILYQGF